MANVFTPVIRNLTTGMQRVAMERAPLPRIAQTDFKADMAALNQIVTIPIAPVVVGGDRTPGPAFTAAADRTVTSTSITITKDRKFAFHMTGDDFLRMQQNPEFIPLSLQQAIRTWRNEIHSDLAGLHINAAGFFSATTPSSGAALGTAGTTPFGSDISLLTGVEKLLNDSLAPLEDRFCFIDTAAKQALGNLNQLIKANEAGSDALLRQGIIGQLSGLNMIWGNDVKLFTAGAGTGALVNNGAGIAAGATSVAFDTMTVNVTGIKAGDVITIAGNSDRYVVGTGSTAAAGTLVLTSGLTGAVADNAAITVLASSRRNLAFHREALGLAVRLPAMPPEGDAGVHQVIVDPETGIGARFSTYKGYGLNNYELSSAWGVAAVRPELLKLILG